MSSLNTKSTVLKQKLTHSQQAILEMLGEVPSAISAQDLYMMFRQRKSVGLATIYRSLEVLKIQGLVKSRVGCQGDFLYSLIEKDTHYLTCLQCGTSIQLDRCPIQSLDPNLDKTGTFTTYYHTLEFFGICGTCKNLE